MAAVVGAASSLLIAAAVPGRSPRAAATTYSEGLSVAAEAAPAGTPRDVLRLRDIGFDTPRALLARYGLKLERVADGAPIPGSYWGDDEAGLIGETVHARADTPVHSLLHEAAHLIVLPSERRRAVHTDATDSVEEEDAVCVLQALLGDALPGVGRLRVLADMDAWGYTFRLGSARAYFELDAEGAFAWLQGRGLLGPDRRLLLPCRSDVSRDPSPARLRSRLTSLLR